MTRACNKHPVVSYKEFGFYTMLCVQGQLVEALIVKIFMPETRTYHKYKTIYIYGHCTDG